MDSSERGMNPVTMTVINPLKEYWLNWGSNQIKSYTQPIQLCGLGACNVKEWETFFFSHSVFNLFKEIYYP